MHRNSSGNQVYYYNACELFNDLYSISLVFFHRHFNPLCCHEYSIIPNTAVFGPTKLIRTTIASTIPRMTVYAKEDF